jgi:hypothetical protein
MTLRLSKPFLATGREKDNNVLYGVAILDPQAVPITHKSIAVVYGTTPARALERADAVLKLLETLSPL